MGLVTDRPFDAESFSREKLLWCEAKLKELEKDYSGGRNDGLLGAVRGGKITAAERWELRSYIDWLGA